MKIASRWAVQIPLLFGLSAGLMLADDAAQVLKSAAETYRGLKSYHFEGTTVSETKVGATVSKSESGFVVAFTAPQEFRLEFIYPTAGNWVRVSDGKKLWQHRSITKESNETDASADDVRMLDGSPVAAFERLDEESANAKIVGSEAVTVGSQSFDCNVVEVPPPSAKSEAAQPLPTRYWIDKTRHIVLKQASGSVSHGSGTPTENTRTTILTVADVNQPVPDELFHLNIAKK